MIGILNFFFVVFVVIIFMVIFVVMSVLGKIQSFIKQIRGTQHSGTTGSYRYGSESQGYTSSRSKDKVDNTRQGAPKKIIPADEGEYVDFEEIP